MTRRAAITDSLVTLISGINGTAPYSSRLYPNNIINRLKFWDEVDDYPFISIVAGDETREYLPGDIKWGFLNVAIKVYVKIEDAQAELEKVLEDIEYVLDNNEIIYDTTKQVEDARILSITTDEGILQPYGVGEMIVQLRYYID